MITYHAIDADKVLLELTGREEVSLRNIFRKVYTVLRKESYEVVDLEEVDKLINPPSNLTKEEFEKLLNFLSDFVGLNDLSGIEYQNELWDNYKKEFYETEDKK
jgi:hypothetical protein